MMSESAQNTVKSEKNGQKAESMVDDAILEVDTSVGTSRPPTFSNKNNPKNKRDIRDANFAL